MRHGFRKGEPCVRLTTFRLVLALLLLTASTARAQDITEFTVPNPLSTFPGNDLRDIVVGPDGALWFNETGVGKVGRITVDGVITEFDVQGPGFGLAVGPDGNLWFGRQGEIGRLTPAGQLTIFPITMAGSPVEVAPIGIVAGPDGNMWFADANSRVGKITMSGVATVFPVVYSTPYTGVNGPYGITLGPDGNLWYATAIGQSVGRITPAGVFTDFPTGSDPIGITSGPDGALWFASSGTVGRISTAGDVRQYAVAAGRQITTGPDGNLWFAEVRANKIGRLTPDGLLTEFPIPTSVQTGLGEGSFPYGITTGPDGNIWFTEQYGNKIGRLTPHGTGTPLCASDAHTLCLNNNRFAVTASFQQTPTGPSVLATAVRLTADSGYFWFFNENNVEVVVKVVNGCVDPFNSYWVFAAGLTNVGVELAVTDTRHGVTQTYSNPIGTAFEPIQDTAAFATCP